jgi:hypothetical protein
MRTVRDGDGRVYVLRSESGESATVYDPETGASRTRPMADLTPVDADPLAVLGAAVPRHRRPLLGTVETSGALGVLVDLHERGPRGVRAMLEAYDRCESDLHGLLAELQVAGAVEKVTVGGERGYALTGAATDALDAALCTVPPDRHITGEWPASSMRAERLPENPLVTAGEQVGNNVNGPSVVRAPDWVDDPLGEYYLYFAHHSGECVRLAYADDVAGPWTVHEPGTLHVRDTVFDDHVASPDVHVDPGARRVRMYFHGYVGEYEEGGQTHRQHTRVAVSDDGLDFTTRPEPLGQFYFRVFEHRETYYALAKANRGENEERSAILVYRSTDPLSGFEPGPAIRADGARHTAVRVRGDTLDVFYSRIGDCPERILHTTVDLRPDWHEWSAPDPETVLEPARDYEGADLAPVPSESGSTEERVCQLRDPAVFEDDGETYLLYTVAGERGIAAARLE